MRRKSPTVNLFPEPRRMPRLDRRTIGFSIVVLALGGLAGPRVSLAELTDVEIAKVAKSSIVFISFDGVLRGTGEIKEVKGTGFLVSKEGHVVTTAHTFKDEDGNPYHDIRELRGVMGGQRFTPPPLPLEKLEANEADLALLHFKEIPHPTLPVTICKSTPETSSDLIGFGFAQNEGLSPVPTTFANSSASGGLWQVTAAFTYGMSGGPVYDKNGRVRGVIKGGRGSEAALRWMIPIRRAQDWLSQHDTKQRCDMVETEGESTSDDSIVDNDDVRIRTTTFRRRAGSRSGVKIEDFGRQWLETELSRIEGLPFSISLAEENEDFLLEVSYYLDPGQEEVMLTADVINSHDGTRHVVSTSFRQAGHADTSGPAMKALAERIGEILCEEKGLPAPEYPLDVIVAVFEFRPPLTAEERRSLRNRVRYRLNSLRLPRMKILSQAPDISDRDVLIANQPEADLLLEGQVGLEANEASGCLLGISSELEMNKISGDSTLFIGLPLDLVVNEEPCEKIERILPEQIALALEPEWRTALERRH